jgi:ubiquinone/menaquinone biosynthesis C-methylase UbiE
VITCRLAAHHFSHIAKAMQEITRVLKPNGVFLLVDHYAPEDKSLDDFINQVDQTRDPSHLKEYT